MGTLILVLAMLALQLGPGWVFNRMTRRYGAHRPDLAYTGKELARLLLDEQGLTEVGVEKLAPGIPDFGDCYDPAKRIVQLSRRVAEGRSVAAYAVAAHEVGHAIQHARHDDGLAIQEGLARFMQVFAWVFLAGFLLVLLFWGAGVGTVEHSWPLGALLAVYLGGSVLLRLMTLPVEWGASYDYALPMLEQRNLLGAADLAGAERLLFVAATTYIAFAALGVLSAVVLLTD
jgi:hypothetical protein